MSRIRKIGIIGLILTGALAVMVLVATVGLDLFEGEPYEMKLVPLEGQTEIIFLRPDENTASPSFRVLALVDTSQTVVLRSGSVSIPGCVIEFSDTTILPGRFKIRIGKSVYDIMERGINVDGKEYDWHKP